ncbi:C40 family peptidase [Oceanobacillus senegalensis]|uniref:C40 family peptidase n=1 Tax=Oceanobacillus senegalensis TaxID=1936063 RepID=UPI000A30D0AF|nr:C40 family peptidase [Oceanobacillus senegalensis]
MYKRDDDLLPEEMWVTNVQVATVWTNPQSAREMDRDGTENPTNMEKWVTELTDKEKVALCDENRIQSQLLYGEPVLVTEIRDGFAHVIIPSQPSKKDGRGYPGWVPAKQLAQVNKVEWVKPLTAAVQTKHAWLETSEGEKEMMLSYLTMLPVEAVGDNRVEVQTPSGKKYLPKDAVHVFSTEEGVDPGDGEAVVKAAEGHLGLSYFWGGMSAFGYDCSGLSYAAHKANGYRIPRDAGDQAKAGKPIPLDAIRPGDLLFFAYEKGKGRIHHVGISTGDGKMIHAPQTGKGVEIISLKGTKYEDELCVARRYWE